MKFAKSGSMRPWTIVIGIGVAIFTFGLCLLIFGRAYYRDPTHHDLLLAFGCTFMTPGGILILFGSIQLFRVYLGETEVQKIPPSTYAPPTLVTNPNEDVFDAAGPDTPYRTEGYYAAGTYQSNRSGKVPI